MGVPLGVLLLFELNKFYKNQFTVTTHNVAHPSESFFWMIASKSKAWVSCCPASTIEEMKQGTSRIRNHVIARVFREINLIEQWGTGVRRIFSEAGELGLPEPKIEEVGMRVRFTIYLAKPHVITPTDKRLESGAQSEAILTALSDGPLSASELVDVLGLGSKTGAFKRAIKELLEHGIIEYTIPDKPNSRLQKYRLVNDEYEDKGKR